MPFLMFFEELLKAKVFTIILGGGQDLSLAQFNAYERIKPCINFLFVLMRALI